MVVTDTHREWETIFAEGMEVDVELVARFGDRHKVTGHLDILRLGFQDLRKQHRWPWIGHFYERKLI